MNWPQPRKYKFATDPPKNPQKQKKLRTQAKNQHCVAKFTNCPNNWLLENNHRGRKNCSTLSVPVTMQESLDRTREVRRSATVIATVSTVSTNKIAALNDIMSKPQI